MHSIVEPNGDVISQEDLQIILGAEAAVQALAFRLKQRIAAGARVQPGKLDVYVEAFHMNEPQMINTEPRADELQPTCVPFAGYGGDRSFIEINTVEGLARGYRRYRLEPAA